MKDFALLFQSLDDVTRLRILALLLVEEELCVCDLVAVLQLPQSTVSRHLSLLKGGGWVKDRREGAWVHYSICRNVTPVQESLLSLLANMLPASKTARGDLERLRSLSNDSCCA